MSNTACISNVSKRTVHVRIKKSVGVHGILLPAQGPQELDPDVRLVNIYFKRDRIDNA
jgi:hypothetical protein